VKAACSGPTNHAFQCKSLHSISRLSAGFAQVSRHTRSEIFKLGGNENANLESCRNQTRRRRCRYSEGSRRGGRGLIGCHRAWKTRLKKGYLRASAQDLGELIGDGTFFRRRGSCWPHLDLYYRSSAVEPDGRVLPRNLLLYMTRVRVSILSKATLARRGLIYLWSRASVR
jgi:hypothetical protein